MFTQSDFSCIDRSYFDILELDPAVVRLRSKRSRHYWRIYCKELSGGKSCLIQHSHGAYDGMHNHARKKSLVSALNSIVQHDIFQLQCRKKEKHRWDEYRPVKIREFLA